MLSPMKRFVKWLLVVGMVACAAVVAARVAYPLPDISGRETSAAIPADADTPLGRLMQAGAARHPGKTGIISLHDGHDALASRLALAAQARHSLDVQYYIWHDDVSGIMLLDALHQAARRGVRVRLLLDDNGVPGLDPFMAALNAEPGFEIRLFNPSTLRNPKTLGYTFDFFRMNRRMHNKSLTADGAATIIGGRNIGDEYFRVGDGAYYMDMDVLATGAVVPETAAVFDDYWNSASVFAVESIIDGTGDLSGFRDRVTAIEAGAEAKALRGEMRSSTERYLDGGAAIEWTDVQLVADDPVKGLGIATRDQLMIARLGEILGNVERRLDLISAYFVPGQGGTGYFADLARGGRDVNILTNALDTTDVLLVHSGYTRYRRALLEAGVDLYELKLRGDMDSEAELQLKPFGVAGASLHAKTFAIDGERVFVGSFNFDPRSATLNCEMGFLIDSAALAGRVSSGFDGPLPRVTYRPELTPEGLMVWQEAVSDDRTVLYQQEPGSSWLQQAGIAILGVLPIEWML